MWQCAVDNNRQRHATTYNTLVKAQRWTRLAFLQGSKHDTALATGPAAATWAACLCMT